MQHKAPLNATDSPALLLQAMHELAASHHMPEHLGFLSAGCCDI
jgi:hypothetical protein